MRNGAAAYMYPYKIDELTMRRENAPDPVSNGDIEQSVVPVLILLSEMVVECCCLCIDITKIVGDCSRDRSTSPSPPQISQTA